MTYTIGKLRFLSCKAFVNGLRKRDLRLAQKECGWPPVVLLQGLRRRATIVETVFEVSPLRRRAVGVHPRPFAIRALASVVSVNVRVPVSPVSAPLPVPAFIFLCDTASTCISETIDASRYFKSNISPGVLSWVCF